MKIQIPDLNLTFDYSETQLNVEFLNENAPLVQTSLKQLTAIESGEKINYSEDRMVGHYWLRDPGLAPQSELQEQITETNQKIDQFIAQIEEGNKFDNILVIGIGGSALGPQFVGQALGYKLKRKLYFFDNTDPSGYEDTLADIGQLGRTLCVTISKSGGTPETFNGMKVAQYAFTEAGLDFSQHAVAVTGIGSKLDQYAQAENWLASFPMYDWIGGRTSIWSAVGAVPLGLAGNFDREQFLAGAKAADLAGRNKNAVDNPAMLLALFWLSATEAKLSGLAQPKRAMVVLPYSDRLGLFSKYLQQLVMESLGKKHSSQGEVVHQGISVFGNKGSTDQHSYVQQLREGPDNFFAIMLRQTQSDSKLNIPVSDDGKTPFDYLTGFFYGTKQALTEAGRSCLEIQFEQVNEHTVGGLLAIFERAVSFYAAFAGINAYDQPGVEAGKKAAEEYLSKN